MEAPVSRKLCLLLALSARSPGAPERAVAARGRQEEQFGAALDSDGRRLVVGALRDVAPGVLFVYHRAGAN
jgi:hypothetical protein